MTCYRFTRGLFICAACLTSAVGCKQGEGRGNKADEQAAEKQGENEPATWPAPARGTASAKSGADSPAHPAVSAQAGGETPQENPSANSDTPGDSDDTPAADNTPDSTPDADSGVTIATPTPPPGALPKIALTAAHRATCKVFVGDTLPPLNITDLDGNPAPLDKNFGPRLTLVVFWQHTDADAVEAVSDLGQLVLSPYGKRGVRAVAIHVGAANEETKSLVQQKHLDVPMFVDADGSALAQVSDDVQGLMPRLFLIDSAGRILWFDIEYSRTTRRDLDAALRYLTRQ